jgi:hypothetical protein
VKKTALAILGSSMTLITLTAVQAANPPTLPGASIAHIVATCGPGYQPKNVTYRDGRPSSYFCEKTIPNLKACAPQMNLFADPPVQQGNSLKLSYTCSLPEG